MKKYLYMFVGVALAFALVAGCNPSKKGAGPEDPGTGDDVQTPADNPDDPGTMPSPTQGEGSATPDPVQPKAPGADGETPTEATGPWMPAVEGPDGIEERLGSLSSTDSKVRSSAAAYFEVKGDVATEWFVAYTSCPKDDVRRGAFYGLSGRRRLDPRQARMADIFIRGLTDTDEQIRSFSIGALSRLGLMRVTEALPQLIKMLDPEKETKKNRMKVVSLLGDECPDPDVVIPKLVEVIQKDPEASVRVGAMRGVRKAVGNRPDPRLLNVWIQALTEDASPLVRRQAATQLESYPPANLAIAQEALRKATKDTDASVRAKAEKMLGAGQSGS